jgi:hypothetical protein
LSGNTSGTATLTAPAVAGTATNSIISSNTIQVASSGAASTPSFNFSASPNSGMYYQPVSQGGGPTFSSAGSDSFEACNNSGLCFPGANWIAWTNGTLGGTRDTSLVRLTGGLLAVGSGGNIVAGSMAASSFQSRGTTFTSSGGCTEGTLVGGATAGKFTTSGSTSCTTIITMGNSATAPTGWDCHAIDLTTIGDVTNPHQTASTTTTATIATGTIVANDVIQFSCIGY